jgi:signal transduction histidine kinase
MQGFGLRKAAERIGTAVCSSLLKKDPSSILKMRRSCFRIASECDRLNKLVEDASEMSQLEAGEIELEGQVARAGAYCRAEGDSVHAKAYSATGCTFLVVASLRDELLP